MRQPLTPKQQLLVRDMYSYGVPLKTIVNTTGFSNRRVYEVLYGKDFGYLKPTPNRGKPQTDKTVDLEIARLINLNKHLPNIKRKSIDEIYRIVSETFPDRVILHTGFGAKYFRVRRQMPKDKFTDSKPLLYLIHEPGEMQVDFGFCEFREKGRKFRGSFLVTAFAYSNAVYVQISKHKKTQDFIKGMQKIFNFIGFVPKICVFDNDPVIVNIRRPYPDMPYKSYRQPIDLVDQFRSFYGFEMRFCTPRSPQQKGVVERMVAFARKSLFVPMPEFEDIEEFNKDLLVMCDGVLNDRKHYLKKRHKLSLLDDERKVCNPLPETEFKF